MGRALALTNTVTAPCGRGIRGGSQRLHAAFVVVEIALAIVLLVSSGSLGRTLLRLAALDPGVNIHNVLVARTAVTPTALADPGRTRAARGPTARSDRG